MTARYTHGHDDSVLRGHRSRRASDSAAYLLPHLRPGMALLDVGSGPGTITADLARAVAPGEVTALEVGDEALALTTTEMAAQGLGVRGLVGDAAQLPLPDGAVDVVHAHQVLQHLGDPVAALREFARVVRPGGIIAVRDADYSGFSFWPRPPELDRWLDTYRRLARHNGAEPDAGNRLADWALRAGLTSASPSASAWIYADEAGRAHWGGMWERRVLDSDFASGAVQAGLASPADLQEMSTAWRDWAATPGASIIIPHGELLIRV